MNLNHLKVILSKLIWEMKMDQNIKNLFKNCLKDSMKQYNKLIMKINNNKFL